MPQANIVGTIRDINGLSVKNASIIFNLMEAGAAAEGKAGLMVGEGRTTLGSTASRSELA